MDKEAANAAALALRHLCNACGAAMVPHLDALMALYQRIQSAGQATTSATAPATQAAVEEADVQQVSSPSLTTHHCFCPLDAQQCWTIRLGCVWCMGRVYDANEAPQFPAQGVKFLDAGGKECHEPRLSHMF